MHNTRLRDGCFFVMLASSVYLSMKSTRGMSQSFFKVSRVRNRLCMGPIPIWDPLYVLLLPVLVPVLFYPSGENSFDAFIQIADDPVGFWRFLLVIDALFLFFAMLLTFKGYQVDNVEDIFSANWKLFSVIAAPIFFLLLFGFHLPLNTVLMSRSLASLSEGFHMVIMFMLNFVLVAAIAGVGEGAYCAISKLLVNFRRR